MINSVNLNFIVFKIIFPKGTPKALKMFLPMILAFALSSSVSKVNVEIINSNYIFFIYLINEVLTGVILGLVTNILFEALKLAGSWIDLHIGFSMLSLADASATSQTTATGTFLQYIAIVLFFIKASIVLNISFK